MVKVSVLVPCCNVEKFLHQCLDSIVKQTLLDIEIICINDGSSDGSLAIIEQYAAVDNRIKVIDKPNSGYGDSMNIGLNMAQGEYIGIVESDDFIELDMFEQLYNRAAQDDLDVVKANFFEYIGGVSTKYQVVPAYQVGEIIKPVERPDIMRAMPSIWSAIYKRDFLLQHNIKFLPTPGASYQDAGFNFKVWFCADKVAFLEQPLLHYRLDNANSSVKSKGKVFCICDEYHEIERFIKQPQYADRYDLIKYEFIFIKMRAYKWNFSRLNYPQNYIFYKLIAQEFALHNQQNLVSFSVFGKKEYKKLIFMLNHTKFSYILRILSKTKRNLLNKFRK